MADFNISSAGTAQRIVNATSELERRLIADYLTSCQWRKLDAERILTATQALSEGSLPPGWSVSKWTYAKFLDNGWSFMDELANVSLFRRGNLFICIASLGPVRLIYSLE